MELQSLAAIAWTSVAGLLVWFCYSFYRARTRFRGLPQPPHSFLWGHLKVMGEMAALMPANCHPQSYLTELSHKYDLPGVYYLDLWPIAYSQVVLNEPGLMDEVQVKSVSPKHVMAREMLEPMVGRDSIVVAEGAEWKKAHRAMAPAFSWSHIRGLTPVMADEYAVLRGVLDRLASAGDVFSYEKVAGNAVFDIIGRTVLNLRLDAQSAGSQYLDDLSGLVQLCEAAVSMNPLVQVQAFFKRRPLVRRLNESLGAKIRERLSSLRRDKIVPSRKDPMSIMDLMLRETVLQDADHSWKQKDPSFIPKKDMDLVLTNMKALLLGGLSTTVDTACWTMMMLTEHPETLQKVREEHDRVFPGTFESTVQTLNEAPEKVGELEYTAAAIKEALRLYPVGFSALQARKGATITHKGTTYPLPPDLMIVPQWHGVHHSETYFPHAAQFRPSRFLEAEGIPRGWFRSFSRGPRACAGENLALEMLKVLFLLTARDYDFELVDKKPNGVARTKHTDMDLRLGDIAFPYLAFESRPRGGVMVRVTKRG